MFDKLNQSGATVWAGDAFGSNDDEACCSGVGAALPTSTTVEVRRLSHPDFLVEVEAMAVI